MKTGIARPDQSPQPPLENVYHLVLSAGAIRLRQKGLIFVHNLVTVCFFFVHNIYGIIIVGERYSTAIIPLVGKPSFRLNVTAILDDKDVNPKKKPPKRKGENYMNKSMYTSINSAKLPKAHSLLDNLKVREVLGGINPCRDLIFDHGCGRYTDHIKKHANDLGYHYIGWDEYWSTDRELPDVHSYYTALYTLRERTYADMRAVHISSNVMNVIKDDWELQKYCERIYDAMRKGEKLILTVYEAKKPSDTQRAEPLALYVEKIESYYGMKTLRQTKSYAILEKR